MHHLAMGLHEHRGQPFALDVERGAQALARERTANIVVEASGVARTIGRGPFHATVDAWEIDGTNDLAIAQRFSVAVLIIGVRFLAHISDEGDRALIRAEGRAREAEPDGRLFEGVANTVAPGPAFGSVVDLVEDDEGLGDEAAERAGIRGDLLIGDRDPVHIRGQCSVSGRPVGIEMDIELLGRERPLQLQMLGRDDDDTAPHIACDQRAADRSEGERRFAGAGRRDREEARVHASFELRERLFLPGPEADGLRQDSSTSASTLLASSCPDRIRRPGRYESLCAFAGLRSRLGGKAIIDRGADSSMLRGAGSRKFRAKYFLERGF